jgi:hypothetical protein
LALVICALAWSACVLPLGVGASTLARSPAQLSAAGDIFALLTTVLGGSLVPVALLPDWLHHLAPANPGYWALDAYRNALIAKPAELAKPLAMLGVFALIGIGIAALIGGGPDLTASLHLRVRRPLEPASPKASSKRPASRSSDELHADAHRYTVIHKAANPLCDDDRDQRFP